MPAFASAVKTASGSPSAAASMFAVVTKTASDSSSVSPSDFASAAKTPSWSPAALVDLEDGGASKTINDSNDLTLLGDDVALLMKDVALLICPS